MISLFVGCLLLKMYLCNWSYSLPRPFYWLLNQWSTYFLIQNHLTMTFYTYLTQLWVTLSMWNMNKIFFFFFFLPAEPQQPKISPPTFLLKLCCDWTVSLPLKAVLTESLCPLDGSGASCKHVDDIIISATSAFNLLTLSCIVVATVDNYSKAVCMDFDGSSCYSIYYHLVVNQFFGL